MLPRRVGCCSLLHITEDNARFLLLAIVLAIYLLSGAAVFQLLEEEEEKFQKKKFSEIYEQFLQVYNLTGNRSAVDRLLYVYGNATATGVVFKRPRWDFSGAFYFVATVVSTIGYGMTTPQTIAGKILVIFYGIFGCSGAILFFNLFLERVITLLAWAMRSFHIRDLRRRGLIPNAGRPQGSSKNGDSRISLDDFYDLDEWKPSVYWVLFYLFLSAAVIALCASAMYSKMEKWTLIESIYFCFVSFSTIGFGDYVSSQEAQYPYVHAYRLANFLLLTLGCCCLYSLFNVVSIVIKNSLNSLIRRLDCRCGDGKRRKSSLRPKGPRPRRNALTPYQIGGGKGNSYGGRMNGERRVSGELISLPDGTNKVSLAVMQKQLFETALLQKEGTALLPARQHQSSFTPGKVGPLAIVTSKLGEDIT